MGNSWRDNLQISHSSLPIFLFSWSCYEKSHIFGDSFFGIPFAIENSSDETASKIDSKYLICINLVHWIHKKPEIESSTRHFGWGIANDYRRHLSWAPLPKKVDTTRTRHDYTLATAVVALSTYVATSCIRLLTNSSHHLGTRFSFSNFERPVLGCIKAKFSDQILDGKLFRREW